MHRASNSYFAVGLFGSDPSSNGEDLNACAALLTKARLEGGFFYLSPRLLIRLAGKDRVRYLNGQISNDLRKLIPGEAMKACVLTPKGKLVALVQIMMDEEALLIEAEEALSEVLPARLERYIVADDVTIEVIAAPEKIHLFGSLLNDLEVQSAPGIIIERLGMLGKDIDVSLVPSLSILSEKKSLPSEILEILRIERGVPRWGLELTAETLPPEARLEENSINYEKGCYLGQEVISRLRSVGHVNRLLCVLVGEEGKTLVPGMEIFSPDDTMTNQPSRPLGLLTSAAEQYDVGRWIGLGYVRRGSDTVGTRLIATDPATGVTVNVIVISRN